MERAVLLDRMRQGEPWDLVIIGGGATGLGSALDSAARRYRTLLLEAHDFAKGTSSRSTKLVHGGVRYLAAGDIGLVRESLHERGLLRRNAPHLVHERAFLVPSYSWWARPYYGLGLKLYDWLAGDGNLGTSRTLSRVEALARVATLEPEGLTGGILYHDGQFDDARLAIALLRTLTDLGGTPVNYAPVTSFLKRDGRISGVVARDAESGEEFPIEARAVINATGVFVDSLRQLDDPNARAMVAPSPRSSPRTRPRIPAGRHGLDDPQDRRRPGPFRDPLARSHADRHHRHARRSDVDRAPPLAPRDRLPAEARRALLDPRPGTGRRPERLRRPATARPTAAGERDADRPDFTRAHHRGLEFGTGHDRGGQVDDLSPHGRRGCRSRRQGRRAPSSALDHRDPHPPRLAAVAARPITPFPLWCRSRRAGGLARRAPRLGPSLASSTPLPRRRGRLGGEIRAGPHRRGRARPPHTVALP